MLRRISLCAAFGVVAGLWSMTGQAQPVTYRLVPDWPKMPSGMSFGLKDAPPMPAEREAPRLELGREQVLHGDVRDRQGDERLNDARRERHDFGQ